ncbi:MAG: restriction endonuclease [Mycobacteriaceae bacterium]
MLHVTDVYRYAKGSSATDAVLDGHPNYHHATSRPGTPKLLLESGINVSAPVLGPDGLRRPVISLRSSPWKAGHESNPWHDEFDLDHGHVRYYGDHKPSTAGLPGSTVGNRALLEAWRLHASNDPGERALAAPLLIWRAVPVVVSGQRKVKGYVEFGGLCVIERLEYVVQRDASTGRSFPNIVLDLAVLELRNDELDPRFLDDRRDPSLNAAACLKHSPDSWQRWVKQGRSALPRVRRRVMSSRVVSQRDQLPSAPDDVRLLQELYTFFDGRKHAFELLAAQVASSLLSETGGRYREGWITRAGGDGGMDFVGRLDVGTASHNTPLVVLGQAKCIKPTSSISPDEVARLVARLRRGWLGVFVTTGTFSRQAQVEIIDDQYPVILVPAEALVTHVRRLAAARKGGGVDGLLVEIANTYESQVIYRRPEEVLGTA